MGNSKIIKPDSQNISDELHTIDARLEEIEAEKERLLHRRHTLQQQQCNTSPAHQLSAIQKVALFGELFKGRSDVFATRWENAKGRNGYAVACHNEWVTGVCNKPKIKCSECSSRQYKSLDDQAIYDHLSGKQVIGLYPLLTDNTCYLLAADFDKTGWQEAVKAMAQACENSNIPYAIEVSRSGNGAHLWIFFSEPVLARDARRLGFGLLDKAMEIHPGLSFESYDRLFPNQDNMPEGGFGNLIALPLQYQARQLGNSEFIDAGLKRYQDQWGYLSRIKRLKANELSRLLEQLSPRLSETADGSLPREQGLHVEHTKITNCPKRLSVTLANHIYFKLDELPAALTARLKRLASFSNPVFFKTQAMRFSTHGIPRYISCARIEQGYLSLPRGCFDEALELLNGQGTLLEVKDLREAGTYLDSLTFLGKLRKDQQKAVETITSHNTGILHAPTAFGKTVTAIGVIKERKVNTLILTHSRQLLEQWQERIKSFVSGVEVGIIGGGKKKPTSQIDIATYQSLIDKKDNSVSDLAQRYGQVIIDECHHISAPRFEMVLNEVRSKYVLGLTATPNRQDGHQKIIFMIAGPVRHTVKAEHGEKFKQTVIVTQRFDEPPHEIASAEKRPHIADVYRWLANDAERNSQIIDEVASSVKKGSNPLLLTERREHADLLATMLSEKNIRTVVLRGAMKARERKLANEQLAEAQVIVATGKYVGEGFDLPRLDTLFLTLPISWKGSLAQYAGRIHRESEGKDRVTIHDYVDCTLPVLQRMYKKREKGYKAMGYEITHSSQR